MTVFREKSGTVDSGSYETLVLANILPLEVEKQLFKIIRYLFYSFTNLFSVLAAFLSVSSLPGYTITSMEHRLIRVKFAYL